MGPSLQVVGQKWGVCCSVCCSVCFSLFRRSVSPKSNIPALLTLSWPWKLQTHICNLPANAHWCRVDLLKDSKGCKRVQQNSIFHFTGTATGTPIIMAINRVICIIYNITTKVFFTAQFYIVSSQDRSHHTCKFARTTWRECAKESGAPKCNGACTKMRDSLKSTEASWFPVLALKLHTTVQGLFVLKRCNEKQRCFPTFLPCASDQEPLRLDFVKRQNIRLEKSNLSQLFASRGGRGKSMKLPWEMTWEWKTYATSSTVTACFCTLIPAPFRFLQPPDLCLSGLSAQRLSSP